MTSHPSEMARTRGQGPAGDETRLRVHDQAQDEAEAPDAGRAADEAEAPDAGRAADVAEAPDAGRAADEALDRRRPAVLAAGLVLLAAAAAFAGFMRGDSTSPPVTAMDQAWLSLVARTRSAPVTDLFKTLSFIGGPDGATIIVAVLCAVLLFFRRWRTALYIALAEACGSGCSQLVKHLVMRHRPPHPLVTADLGSFPSGHVITTVGVGLALAFAFARPGHRRYWLLGVAAAGALMMFCRTYLAAHWLSDTLESLPIATGLALVLWWIFTPLLAHDRGQPLQLPWPAADQ
jgi:membrane-associated phospholipid phosphatase